MEVRSPTEQILFATVRVETDTPHGTSTGTAFVFRHHRDGNQYDFLVTNKHVIAEATEGRLFFTVKGGDGNPLIGHRRDVRVGDFERRWHGHPDPNVDVAVMGFVH